MADSLARKAAQQDDLLSKLDSIAREFDNYDYGLPMSEECLEQMRAEIDKYDAEALASMREALQEGLEIVRIFMGTRYWRGRVSPTPGGWVERTERLLRDSK